MIADNGGRNVRFWPKTASIRVRGRPQGQKRIGWRDLSVFFFDGPNISTFFATKRPEFRQRSNLGDAPYIFHLCTAKRACRQNYVIFVRHGC